tara:strand:+ start:185 stop:1888 length:1704 start_codon:yes stop_codon:yes gene_type:complete
MQRLDYGFISLDDSAYITKNSNIKAGLTGESIAWAFSTSYSSNWHPVTWLSHMLDIELYGLNPRGHHRTNILFHIANTLLLFCVLLRMTGARWRSGFVAVLFAVHPLNIESVAWVSERKNVLSTLFWFLTVWAYISYAKKKRIKNYLLVVLFLVLGLMSKPMLVTLPFVLLLLDYWPLKRFAGELPTLKETRQLGLEKIPLFALAVASSVITYIVQKNSGAMSSLENVPLDFRLANTLSSYVGYLWKMLWPDNLSIFYPYPNSISESKTILCGLALVILTYLAIDVTRRMPYIAVGWFWYLGTLVPVIGLVQVGAQAMADRYMYIPMIGIFITIAWGLGGLKKNAEQYLFPILTPIIALMLAMATSHQLNYWASSTTLMKRALQTAKDKNADLSRTHKLLANALIQEQEFEKAVFHYKESIRLNPNQTAPYNNIGNALAEIGEEEEAISYYQKAVKVGSNPASAYKNLGNLFVIRKEFGKAIINYKGALKIEPNDSASHINLGNALAESGEFESAINHYKVAIKLNPDKALTYLNLANVLSLIDNLTEARYYKEIAFKLNPELELFN